MQSERKVHNAKGQLTAYGFACGYQHSAKEGENSKSICKEHPLYVVRSSVNGIVKTITYTTLGRAMKHYLQIAL